MVIARDVDWDPSAPAPDGLERVRCFLNTLDLYRHRDGLAEAQQAQELLQKHMNATSDIRVTEADLGKMRRARAALRQSVGCSTIWPTEGTGSLAQRVPNWNPRPRLLLGTDRIEADERSLDGFLSSMALELLVAQRIGTLGRLKVCANTRCQWVFWDASRPGTGRWCSMRVCGGQSKSRRFREKPHRTGGPNE